MTLSTEDYENIWLRMKDRLGKWVVGYVMLILFLPITVLTTFGLDKMTDFKIDEKVEQKLSSENLASKITESLSKQIDTVNSRLESTKAKLFEIEKSTTDLENFAKGLPIKVEGNRLTISSSVGSNFIIEKGYCTPIGNVKFSSQFNEIPTIFLTDCPTFIANKPSNIYVSKVSKTGFYLFSKESDDFVRRVSWLAVSK